MRAPCRPLAASHAQQRRRSPTCPTAPSLAPPRSLPCHASTPRSPLSHPRQMISIYNVTLSGSSKDLYADSVAVLSWATFNWDGA
eukprot:scaffold76565_cov61-Phaeocystis_antarctica.AAC.3